MGYRYDPLREHLASQAESVVVMTYTEIETLLGRKLPNTAYGDSWRQWWANTETHSQALAWLRAGWRVTRPDRRQPADAGASGLRTAPRAPAAAAAASIALPADSLTPSAVRMIEDAAEALEGDLGRAAAELLNRAAMARRRQLLDWFAENAPHAGASSVDLVREDRDAR